jgi:aminoglycoside phosphotransferase (APT) family kinase protein
MMAWVNRIDPVTAEPKLTTWLTDRLPDASDMRVTDLVVPAKGGLSYETVLFDASWTVGSETETHRFVARVAPAGPGVFQSYDLRKEYEVAAALHENSGVPIARPWWYEPEPDVLGAPFMVMDRVDGSVPQDEPPYTVAGWVLELPREGQLKLYRNALDALIAVHAVDWRKAGLSFLGRAEPGETPFDQQLARWRRSQQWSAAGDANPTVEAAFAWLERNRPPADEPTCLNWGDARIGNMIFDGGLGVGAVLDWEMVCLASPELDLGWWLLLQRYFSEGFGAGNLPGFPDRSETIALYEQLSGHKARHLEAYEVFAAVRLAVLIHRTANMMISRGLLPADSPMKVNNPATQFLAEMLELPAPGDRSASSDLADLMVNGLDQRS